MNFRYIIVDDEPLARKLIATHASKIEGLVLAGECNGAIAAANILRNDRVDLIFLDVQMPELDGLSFIGTLKNPPAIILTTAFRDFAPEAFDLDVVDYLLKPISFERLLKAVNKFFERSHLRAEPIENAINFIYVRADRKMHKISLSDIIFIESMDEYVRIHLPSKTLLTRENISTLESKLANKDFVRIHRSFLVSTKCIISVSAEGVEIAGKILPFGRAYKLGALAALRVKLT